MDKNVVELWVKALRSGKYKQTRRVLKDKNGYCCLGVLAEEMGVLDEKDECYGDYETLEKWGKNGTCPLRNGEGWIDSMRMSLASMNDDGHSFEEIADFIEEQADKL